MYNPQLKTFVAVAESGSFSKAAETLYLTPTAVMKQINAIEKGISVVLFNRTNRGLTLTKAGESFLQDAKYIIDYSERAVQKARDADAEENRKTIRVGTSVMTPAKFVLDIWEEIHYYDKNLKIELVPFENNPVNSREILHNLGQHIDIVAGLYDDGFLEERGCRAAHLYDKKLLLAVPLTHPLSGKGAITMSDLKGGNVMMIRRGWNIYIDRMREDMERGGVGIVEFDMFNLAAFNRAAAENIPIITVEGWEDVHPLMKLISAGWDYRVPFGILYSPNPSKLVERFIDIVQKITRR